MVVEPFLVAPVATFYLAVVPWYCGANCLMGDMQFVAEYIQWMYALCLLCMVKFSTVIGLDNIRCVTEIDNCPLYKIYGAIAAVFFLGINEPLSGCFFYHCVLVEFFTIRARIADDWHIFHIHLLLFTQFRRRIVVS